MSIAVMIFQTDEMKGSRNLYSVPGLMNPQYHCNAIYIIIWMCVWVCVDGRV